jgi:elongation factor P
MYTISDFRRGLKILFNNEPYEIIKFQHYRTGKGSVVIRTKIRNMITLLVINPTFRLSNKFQIPDLEERDVQFLYSKNKIYYFMDSKTFEQFESSEHHIKHTLNFLVDDIGLSVLLFKKKIVLINLPNSVVLKVIRCDPAIHGNTINSAKKNATITTGYSCNVPLFINKGEKIRINTRSGLYMERG